MPCIKSLTGYICCELRYYIIDRRNVRLKANVYLDSWGYCISFIRQEIRT